MRLAPGLAVVVVAAFVSAPFANAGTRVDKAIVTNVAAQGAQSVAADDATNRIFVGTAQGSIEKLDGATRKLEATISLHNGAVTGIAVDPSSDRVFAIERTSEELVAVDGLTNAVIGRVRLPAAPRAVAVDHAQNRVYVAVGDATALPSLVVLTVTPPFGVVGTVPLFAGLPVSIAIATHPFDAVLVSLTGGPNAGHIAVVSETSNAVVADLGLPQCAPAGIAFDAKIGELFVTRPICGSVLRLDFAPGSWTARFASLIPVAPHPFAAAVVMPTDRVDVLSGRAVNGVAGATVSLFDSAPSQSGPNALIDTTSLADGSTDLDVDDYNGRTFVANPTAAVRPTPSTRTQPGVLAVLSRFDSTIHGFAFVNSFSATLSLTVPPFGTFDLARFPYGLCGGMTYAALDDFYAGGGAAPGSSPPQSGPLHGYLWGRILDSLEPHTWDTVRRLVKWMALPIDDKNGITGHVTGLHTRTLREFNDKIRPSLDTGHPVPLAIVKASFNVGSSNFGEIWTNHQELAFGYMQVGSEWVLLAYDPNEPGRTAYLWLDRRVETVTPTGGAVDHFRGIFANADNYAPHVPFWVTP